MANAWMLRNDGIEFPVVIHPYATDDFDETLGAAAWLADHTASSQTKELCLKYFAAYAAEEDDLVEPDEIAETLEYVIKRKPYKIAESGFFKKFAADFERIDPLKLSPIARLREQVEKALNDEFLRARIGGAYTTGSTSPVSGDMYFRVSSEGFNWIDIIWHFVERNRNRITTVTIVKDPDSTGVDNQYYNIDNQPAYRMPVEDFINSSSRNVVDSWKNGPQFEKRDV